MDVKKVRDKQYPVHAYPLFRGFSLANYSVFKNSKEKSNYIEEKLK